MDAAIKEVTDNAKKEKDVKKKEQDFYKEKADEQENDLDEIIPGDLTPQKPLPAEIDPQDLQGDRDGFDEWQSALRTFGNKASAANTVVVNAKASRDNAANNAINNAKKENENKRKETDKQTGKEYQNAENNHWNTYYAAAIAADSAYMKSYKQAEKTFNNAETKADDAFMTTVIPLAVEFEKETCRLLGRFYDAVEQANLGYGVDASFYANGATSTNVQVCFAAGFEIELTDGTKKRVEDFDGTEEIWARHHNDPMGPLQKCKVTRAFKNGIKETMLVVFDNGLELRGTQEHPFYVQEKGWVPLGDLMVGDVCFDRGQNPVVVKEIIRDGKQVEVFNIEVEGCHTYYVGKNGLEVLVHNECPICRGAIQDPPIWLGPVYSAAKFGSYLFSIPRKMGIGYESWYEERDRALVCAYYHVYGDGPKNGIEKAHDIVDVITVASGGSALLLQGGAAAGITELGKATSARCAYYILWNEATVVGATGTMFPAAYQASRTGIPIATVQQATVPQRNLLTPNNGILVQNNSVIIGQHINTNTQLMSQHFVGATYNPALVSSNMAIASNPAWALNPTHVYGEMRGVIGLPRVGSALKVDFEKPGSITINGQVFPHEFAPKAIAHGFPKIVDNYVPQATYYDLGNGATLFQISGSYNGVLGRFEWIVQNGAVTHRMFIHNGTITGLPIKP